MNKEEIKEYLFKVFETFPNRKLPSTAAFMCYLYDYKWENYQKTYSMVKEIRKLYLDYKSKGLI